MRCLLVIAALTAVLACGAAVAAATTSPSTRLTITYWPAGRDDGTKKSWTLRCDPVGGTLVRAGAACRRLASLQSPFALPRPGLMCTQQYGGPDQAQITGIYNGRFVSVALGLADGCQISRFRRLAFLVPGFGG